VSYGDHHYWHTLFVMSQYDIIFTFANQRFGEVCWHNMHIQGRRSSGRSGGAVKQLRAMETCHFGVRLLSGIFEKQTPKCMWLYAGISLLLFGLRTWLKCQKTWQVF